MKQFDQKAAGPSVGQVGAAEVRVRKHNVLGPVEGSMDMNDPVERSAKRQSGRPEQIGLFGEEVLRGGFEQQVEVGRHDADFVGFRIEPHQIAV